MTSVDAKGRRSELYAEALSALSEAFDEGFHVARVELASGKLKPLRDARFSFRLKVPRLDLLEGRWHLHELRFMQVGRAAALAAGVETRALLTPDPSNGTELIGPLELSWTVSFEAATPAPPTLTRDVTGSWVVRIALGAGVVALHRGNSPGAAIALAADDVPAGMCTACAGTRVSRHWDGTGDHTPCATCLR